MINCYSEGTVLVEKNILTVVRHLSNILFLVWRPVAKLNIYIIRCLAIGYLYSPVTDKYFYI